VLGHVQLRQVVQAGGRVGVLAAQRLLADGERAREQRGGQVVAAERAVQAAKQLETSCKAGDLSHAPAQVEEVLRAVDEVIAALRAEIGD
jgi:HPt (histidine-containing phosphotransfer) domain-containing protein